MSGKIIQGGIKLLKKLMPKKMPKVKDVDLTDEVTEAVTKKETSEASEAAAKKASAEPAEKVKALKEKDATTRADYGEQAAKKRKDEEDFNAWTKELHEYLKRKDEEDFDSWKKEMHKQKNWKLNHTTNAEPTALQKLLAPANGKNKKRQ